MLRLWCCFHPFYNIWLRACVSASAWILVGLEFQSPPALTKTSNRHCSLLRRTVCGRTAETIQNAKKTLKCNQTLSIFSRGATRPLHTRQRILGLVFWCAESEHHVSFFVASADFLNFENSWTSFYENATWHVSLFNQNPNRHQRITWYCYQSSLAPTGVWASWWRDLEVDFERAITMILNTSHLTFLVLLYSSTSRYPHPAIRSTPCEVHPDAGGTFSNILFLSTGTHKISLQHMFNTVV